MDVLTTDQLLRTDSTTFKANARRKITILSGKDGVQDTSEVKTTFIGINLFMFLAIICDSSIHSVNPVLKRFAVKKEAHSNSLGTM